MYALRGPFPKAILSENRANRELLDDFHRRGVPPVGWHWQSHEELQL